MQIKLTDAPSDLLLFTNSSSLRYLPLPLLYHIKLNLQHHVMLFADKQLPTDTLSSSLSPFLFSPAYLCWLADWVVDCG